MNLSGTPTGRVAIQVSPPVISQHTEVTSDKSVSSLVRQLGLVQNSQRQLLKQTPNKAEAKAGDFLSELSKKLAERASGTDMTDNCAARQALKPWQLELANNKAAYAQSASSREAAEIKEDARVATALNAEAAEKAKQKAAEAEKANKTPVALKLDTNGIPLPPPPPPPVSNIPQKLFSPTSGMNNKATAGQQGKKAPDKSLQAEVLGELAAKLAKRAGNASLTDNTPAGQVQKPWQVELARAKAEFANSAEERKAAEVKEEARVAAALNAEAAEKAKQKAADIEKANREPVTLTLDANGIPLPPPPPPPPVNHIPGKLFNQTK